MELSENDIRRVLGASRAIDRRRYLLAIPAAGLGIAGFALAFGWFDTSLVIQALDFFAGALLAVVLMLRPGRAEGPEAILLDLAHSAINSDPENIRRLAEMGQSGRPERE
ncbi:MAG: hypothetical protein PVJ40_09085 [Gammaproteobacteria bacterium]|jgi:hypothetical protein